MRTLLMMLVWTAVMTTTVAAQQQFTVQIVSIGEKLTLSVPGDWPRKEPKSKIVEHEFAIPAAEGDDIDGRMIMMGAGGTVEANLDRWVGQFVQADGSDTKQQAKIRQKEVAGQKIHTIDVAGIYKDRPRGPLGPSVDKPNYRMLGAIIVTQDSGSYFVKLYGPAATVAANETAFHVMLDGLKNIDQPAE